MEVVAAAAGDPAVRWFLRERGSDVVARRGELVDALVRPALVACAGEEVLGVLTFDVVQEECEVLTLHSAHQWAGTGTRLIEEVTQLARDAGCTRLWLVTTDDNVDALRFYQRRGFSMTDVRPGAVDESRRELKPAIPPTGLYGIPLRDELELSRPI